MVIAPFWFSTEHLWMVIVPFLLSTNDMTIPNAFSVDFYQYEHPSHCFLMRCIEVIARGLRHKAKVHEPIRGCDCDFIDVLAGNGVRFPHGIKPVKVLKCEQDFENSVLEECGRSLWKVELTYMVTAALPCSLSLPSYFSSLQTNGRLMCPIHHYSLRWQLDTNTCFRLLARDRKLRG